MKETAVECFTIYEEQVTDAKQKKQVLELIINSCLRLNCLSDENYDTLVTNIISFCSKIMKKNEQCQILLSCCFLFTNHLVHLFICRLMSIGFIKYLKDVPNWQIIVLVNLWSTSVSFSIYLRVTCFLLNKRRSLKIKTMPLAKSLVQLNRN